MKGVELDDKPYKVVFMDKTANIVTFESTVEHEKWMEVTDDSLVVHSADSDSSADSAPEGKEDESKDEEADPLREPEPEPEQEQPTFRYWSALWKST